MYIFFFFVQYFLWLYKQSHTHEINEEKKKKKNFQEREKKFSLALLFFFFFQSHNNTHCSNSCVVDHHTTSSSSSIELHKSLYVFRLTFSDSVCLTGFFFYFFFSFLEFFYYSTTLEEKDLACCHSLIHSFTHLTLAETTYREQEERRTTSHLCSVVIQLLISNKRTSSICYQKVEN